ncbi:ComF family protein [Microbacteriaceae bacterium 4G12]
MRYCLVCGDELSVSVGWFSFFLHAKPAVVCSECNRKFEMICGELCECCGRPLSALTEDYKRNQLCLDCVRWQEDTQFQDILSYNRSVYMYNDWMKAVLAHFKFRGDAALVELFAESFRSAFSDSFSSSVVVVPMPLSNERLYERCFNQAELLANLLPISSHNDILTRTHSEKQSKKTRNERMKAQIPFSLVSSKKIVGQEVVLIDDIYTTGVTVRQAAYILRQGGAKSVSALTLCRG